MILRIIKSLFLRSSTSEKTKVARMERDADREAFEWVWEHELSDEEKEKVKNGEWSALHTHYLKRREIGNNSADTDNTWGGKIDEVMVFNRILPPPQDAKRGN